MSTTRPWPAAAITANALTVKATENNTLVAVTGGVAVTLGGSVAVGPR